MCRAVTGRGCSYFVGVESGAHSLRSQDAQHYDNKNREEEQRSGVNVFWARYES